MRKTWRQLLVGMSALTLVLSAACSNKENAPQNNEEGVSNTPAQEKREKVSMMFNLYGTPAKETEAWKKLEDTLNIDLELLQIPDNGYAEKMNVTMASGDLPDMMLWHGYPSPSFNKYIEQGAFKPLSKYLTPENAPNLMKTPKAVWDAITINGDIYGVPRPRALSGSAVIIRKDWLDNLNLPIPKTTDELFKTAVAFSNDDPDQNGKNDTAGLIIGENLGHLESLWNAFDTGNNYRIMEDGTLANSITTDGKKQAVKWLTDLYKAGGIYKDFPLLKKTDVVEKMSSGKAGIELGSTVSDFGGYVTNIAKIDPKAELIMIDPPVGPTGKSGFNQGLGFFGQWVIANSTPDEKVEKLIKVLDWMASDEATALKQYGVEGVHYKVENGEKVLITEKYEEDAVNNLIQHNGFDPYLYISTADTPEMKAVKKEYLDKIPNMLVPNPADSFSPPAQDEVGAELTKIVNSYQSRIVMGELPFTDWDKMVKEWKEKGGDRVTQEVNEWYKSKSKQ